TVARPRAPTEPLQTGKFAVRFDQVILARNAEATLMVGQHVARAHPNGLPRHAAGGSRCPAGLRSTPIAPVSLRTITYPGRRSGGSPVCNTTDTTRGRGRSASRG